MLARSLTAAHQIVKQEKKLQNISKDFLKLTGTFVSRCWSAVVTVLQSGGALNQNLKNFKNDNRLW